MSLEAYLLVNLAVDGALLTAVSRALGTFRLRRIAAASVLCAAYAVVAAVRPSPWSSPPVQLALLGVVSWFAVGRANARLCALTALSLAAGALASGGAALLLCGASTGPFCGALAALPGIALFAALIGIKGPMRGAWHVDIGMCVNGRIARFPALIDTGNRLREPISGQPVLIAEAALLRGVLPEGGCRRVAFGALGGEGRLECFRPSKLWIECGGRRTSAPPAWVAVVPGRLPGAERALAPCEFAYGNK